MEIWKTIIEYPNYEVSSDGRVRNTKTGRVLRSSMNKDGYQYVGLCLNGNRKNHKIHRLVASIFIPNPKNKPDVNHINGNKADNRIENLEWVNASENAKHAYQMGLRSDNQHCRCIETGQIFESQNHAAKYFGCCQGSIRDSIHTGCRCKGYHFELT